MSLNSTFVGAASLFLGGCLSGLVPDGDSGGSSTGTTGAVATGVPDPTGNSSGSTFGGASTSDAADSASQGTSSGFVGASSSGSETGDAPEACSGADEQRTASVPWNGSRAARDGWENVDAMCLVDGFERGGGTSEYSLECDEGGPEPAERVLIAPFVRALSVGMTVRLRYLRQDVTDGRYYVAFAIHDLEGTLLVGNYRNRIPATVPTDPVAFFAPFEFTPVRSACPPVLPPEDDGREFISNPCPLVRTPLAVNIASEGETTTVLDRAAGSLSEYEFHVSAAAIEFVDPDAGCGASGDVVSVHIFAE